MTALARLQRVVACALVRARYRASMRVHHQLVVTITSIVCMSSAIFASSCDRSAASTVAPTRITVTGPIRVAFIGASATAGFGCVLKEQREDGPYTCGFCLKDMVQLACPQLELLTSDLSSSFFFMDPLEAGARSAKRAQAFQPDCVVALDFLFWFAYGDDAPGGTRVSSEEDRAAKFELGLKELEQFTAPVIVGDLPNMSSAVGKMLSRTQMPDVQTLAQLNTRLKEWAKTHANVRVIALSSMLEEINREHHQAATQSNASNASGAKQRTQSANSTGLELLQRDDLHPAPRGLARLACAVANELNAVIDASPIAATGAANGTTHDAGSDTDTDTDTDCVAEPVSTFERARGELKRSGPAAAPRGASDAKALPALSK